jgi:hypothetical protein
LRPLKNVDFMEFGLGVGDCCGVILSIKTLVVSTPSQRKKRRRGYDKFVW